jgi:hypothetical protein
MRIVLAIALALTGCGSESVDTQSESHTDGNGDGGATPCVRRTEATCTSDLGCRPYVASPLSGDEDRSILICLERDFPCGDGDAVSCARKDDTGELFTFPQTCVPPGWTYLPSQDCYPVLDAAVEGDTDLTGMPDASNNAPTDGGTSPMDAAATDGD